ncbi:pyrroline-5-carboxylate reductase [Candidatus Uhrbacteria bacterium]|nr:pyrroline-5-carboxylate reductase [Candidatus Uhrbacteria bacterium]
MNIGIIGYGVMGEAIASALVRQHGCEVVVVFDVDPTRCACAQESSVTVIGSIAAMLPKVEILVLAVKPQQYHVLASEMNGHIGHHLVISIMAGISLDQLEEQLDTSRVVRTMPNTPAQIGQGLTVWIASGGVTPQDKLETEQILSAFGKHLELKNEDMVNAATAISGSGPAYVFLLAQALEESAIALGFDRETARLLVTETLRGSSALYYDQRQVAPQELRRRVTSPGGTTNAAMESLGVEKFVELWKAATQAAYKRAQELSQR